ncbi:hypothetical protein EDB81DRAFT_887479 [Dactylonectria macrodidyma]|uniref:Uncharacterized protein n=1 Tax=Dactylonectria macrodidyma TaxID=307937 RepID=A0A9P9IVB8_9HYPO|nr:hypothetical protein EDB81DRAFT_887479 [Dactylonectria macrodidyma]
MAGGSLRTDVSQEAFVWIKSKRFLTPLTPCENSQQPGDPQSVRKSKRTGFFPLVCDFTSDPEPAKPTPVSTVIETENVKDPSQSKQPTISKVPRVKEIDPDFPSEYLPPAYDYHLFTYGFTKSSEAMTTQEQELQSIFTREKDHPSSVIPNAFIPLKEPHDRIAIDSEQCNATESYALDWLTFLSHTSNLIHNTMLDELGRQSITEKLWGYDLNDWKDNRFIKKLQEKFDGSHLVINWPRCKTQNAVMGNKSAVKIAKDFFGFNEVRSAEWLHRSAYSYGGLKTVGDAIDPETSQNATNLVFGTYKTYLKELVKERGEPKVKTVEKVDLMTTLYDWTFKLPGDSQYNVAKEYNFSLFSRKYPTRFEVDMDGYFNSLWPNYIESSDDEELSGSGNGSKLEVPSDEEENPLDELELEDFIERDDGSDGDGNDNDNESNGSYEQGSDSDESGGSSEDGADSTDDADECARQESLDREMQDLNDTVEVVNTPTYVAEEGMARSDHCYHCRSFLPSSKNRTEVLEFQRDTTKSFSS